MKFVCKNCKSDVNMVITLTTEQPSKYWKKLPSKISVNPRTSLNSSWVNWGDAAWICPNCRHSGQSLTNDCEWELNG